MHPCFHNSAPFTFEFLIKPRAQATSRTSQISSSRPPPAPTTSTYRAKSPDYNAGSPTWIAKKLTSNERKWLQRFSPHESALIFAWKFQAYWSRSQPFLIRSGPNFQEFINSLINSFRTIHFFQIQFPNGYHTSLHPHPIKRPTAPARKSRANPYRYPKYSNRFSIPTSMFKNYQVLETHTKQLQTHHINSHHPKTFVFLTTFDRVLI